MSLLTVSDLSVNLAGTTVLHDIDLTIDRGEIVTIVGPNGSGKSTLLRTIVGAINASSGDITHAAKLAIGYVPQHLKIDPTFPVTVRRFLNLPKPVSDSDAGEVLLKVGVATLGGRQLTQLSGGQFQRVLLARALLGKPDLLILDEATQGLDQSGSATFYRLIDSIRQDLNCAVLMVSHELHVVMAASDRVICLNGHVCCEGHPEHVMSAPEYRALFGSGTQGALALYRHQHSHSHDATDTNCD
jgi:zinc transport system ATP-binding protein